jgi:hypothetical protein
LHMHECNTHACAGAGGSGYRGDDREAVRSDARGDADADEGDQGRAGKTRSGEKERRSKDKDKDKQQRKEIKKHKRASPREEQVPGESEPVHKAPEPRGMSRDVEDPGEAHTRDDSMQKSAGVTEVAEHSRTFQTSR